jgi:tetratricopeptide (TPR) repeat protein
MTHPRSGTVLALVVLTSLAGGANAIKPNPKPAEKPPYQRLLQGDDAKQAAKLQKRIGEREAADDYAGAVEAAEELLALRQRVQGADHHEVVSVQWHVAVLRKVAALPAEQRAAWREAEKGGREASQLEAQGRYAAALPLYQKALDLRRRVLGEGHPHTATSYNNLAYNLWVQGQHAQAEPLFQKALDIQRRVLGEDHPHTARSYHNLAANLNAQGQHAQA